MYVLAALGDAPTAAIAVVAIALGLFLAARGPRERRAPAQSADERPGPAMLSLPLAAPAPDVEPGFVGPEGTIVGHGPIRLGAHAPLAQGESAAPAPAAAEPAAAQQLPVAEPPPAVAPPPVAQPVTAEPVPAETEPEPAAVDQPPAPEAEPGHGPPAEEPPPDVEPSEPKDPAWRVAARAANSAVHFRQGTIKIGGRPVGKRKDR